MAIDDPATRDFGTQCLIARRLSEAGVRFIEVSNNGLQSRASPTKKQRATGAVRM